MEYLDFLQKYRGKIKFKRGGTPIDSLYMKLTESYPEHFSADVVNPYEQMERLGEVYDTLQRKEMSVEEYYGDQAKEFKNAMYDEYSKKAEKFVNKMNRVYRYKKANVESLSLPVLLSILTVIIKLIETALNFFLN